MLDDVAAVAIGRNEGARLDACLASLRGSVTKVVYVDSGSADQSVVNAQSSGAIVRELDMSTPFTAGRARNTGIAAAREALPSIRYIQLVDGDCTVAPGWIEKARAFLESHPDVGAVCGRRREKFPDASIYNRLCDWEWDTRVGEALACGGDALMRIEALPMPGPYDESVIAAEDDELCIRMRKAGWKVWRLEAEMTMHDAAIHAFRPWWRRMVRAGHAFAQVGNMHPPYFSSPRQRLWVWAAILPAAALVAAATVPLLSLMVIALYGLSWARTTMSFRRYGFPLLTAARSSALILISKFSNLQGYFMYWMRRARRERATLIEYK